MINKMKDDFGDLFRRPLSCVIGSLVALIELSAFMGIILFYAVAGLLLAPFIYMGRLWKFR